MNSLKILLFTVVYVKGLTLNERGISEKSSTHHKKKHLQMGHLDVEKALTQLRAAVEREKQVSGSNATETSLFTSASLNALTVDPQKTLLTGSKWKSVSRTPNGEAAVSQSGGGCHSAVGQYAFTMAVAGTPIKLLTKQIAQGRQITKNALKNIAPALFRATSSGGSWMWATVVAARYSGPGGKNFQKRVGWIDAVVIPNVNRDNWKAAMLGVGKKSAVMKTVGANGLETYETMIANSLQFYLQVRKDPSLVNMPMQDIVKADLVAQAQQGDAEVKKIAAQYGVDATQSNLLSAIKKVAEKLPHKGSGLAREVRERTGECDTSAEWPDCTKDDLISMFGTTFMCVKNDVLGAVSSSVGGWYETVWTKFLKPFGVPQKTTFEDMGYDLIDTWEILTTKTQKPWKGDTTASIMDRTSSGKWVVSAAEAGVPIVPAVGASSNFGLGVYFLVYFTKSPKGYNCGPNVAGAAKFWTTSKMGRHYAKEIQDFTVEFLNAPASKMAEAALELAANVQAVANGNASSISYWEVTPQAREAETFQFDGMNLDNTAFAPLLAMMSGSEAPMFPTVLVTSTGNEEFDFMAVASFFLEYLPVKFAAPVFDVALPMEYLCGGDVGEIPTKNINYLLEKHEWECLNIEQCPQDLFKFGYPCTDANNIPQTTADNLYLKLQKTGILYLEDVITLTNTFWGTSGGFLEALSFATSIHTEESFGWLGAFVTPEERHKDEYLEKFPTFPVSSLMNIPLKYAKLMSMYYEYMAAIMLGCFGGQELTTTFEQGCGAIYCQFTKEYVFPAMPI